MDSESSANPRYSVSLVSILDSSHCGRYIMTLVHHACSKRSYNTYPQLYLDDNGIIDIKKTQHEADKVSAAKMNADQGRAQNKSLRRRRSQLQQDAVLLPEAMKQLVDESEFEGWVFGSFLDCKVGAYCLFCSLMLNGDSLTLQFISIIPYRHPHPINELP